MADTAQCTAIHALKLAASLPNPDTITRAAYHKVVQQSKAIPHISAARLERSLTERQSALDIAQVRKLASSSSSSSNGYPPPPDQDTYLYLGYGSNMCALSFLERRGIRPLGQMNIVAPEFQLSFDLTGTPYSEPCFGNLKLFEPHETGDDDNTLQDSDGAHAADYHKDRWRKGLVAVVYEVSAADFAHILATEGGGVSYQWVQTDCYALSSDPHEPVPLRPTNVTCRAWTLYAERETFRTDPSYAQPSARYLKLLTDGGYEHDLPTEYRDFMDQIRPYTVTTKAQTVGLHMTQSIWLPLATFFFKGGGKIFLREDGSYPGWYGTMALAVYRGIWNGYDNWFKPRFGDGERTIGDGGSAPSGSHPDQQDRLHGEREWNEKMALMANDMPGSWHGDDIV